MFVSIQPAEMILLTGKPSYLAVQGAPQLLWVNNTESDLFRMGLTGPVYVLVSGRWFSAPDFTGPWTFATPAMPEDFKKIPLEHPRSRVLASVPGTRQASEAVLLAQIPQTARVAKTVQAPEVAYQGGAPQFQPIETTTVQRAVNTDKDIFKVGDLYYMCFQGVWFMSKAPTGPWVVTGDVPTEIYTIPVSSPSHAVTYVTVEESNDDAVVFATAAAFTGMMVAYRLRGLGDRILLPTLRVVRRRLSVLPPVLSQLWLRRLLQPVDRRLQPRRRRLRAVWRRRRGDSATTRAPAPTPRGAVAWGPYGARGAASAYNPRTGSLRRDSSGLERLRQLGSDRRGARRRLGRHRTRRPTT